MAPVRRAYSQALLHGLLACAREPVATQRLSCYDRLAKHARASASGHRPESESSPAAVASHAASPAAPGSSPPEGALAEFGVGEGPLARRRQEHALEQITSRISAISRAPGGELIVTLDNGQVWVQTEPSVYFPLKIGDEVRIRAAALGSYLLLAPSRRTTRVMRTE